MCYGKPVSVPSQLYFLKTKKRVAHGNDALCRDRFLEIKIAQT